MTAPWTKFRNLCRYYADCVKYSEKRQEYLFSNQIGISFMMPRLPFDWHVTDGEFVVETSPDDVFVRSNLLKASDEEELFIGYPLQSFISPNGVECLCPIMMFPVSISVRGAGYAMGMKMKIDWKGVSINQEWIEYHIPKADQKSFQRACEQADDESGRVDVELVLNYMSHRFGVKELSPNSMAFSVSHSQSMKGLLNTAVLFEGNKTTYTKNLISELRRISTEPDAVLDKTALAYVFRDPPFPNDYVHGDNADEKRIPVSFTKRSMNAGQFEAVEESLNRPVVKVSGPPGTGKSFMAVNLIANEVLHGGSVLFTSKNHKAIHAIFDKAPDAIQDSDFPLVSFCTTPDNNTNADWQESQSSVDGRVGFVKSRVGGEFQLVDELQERLSWWEKLDVALSQYRDVESHIARYQYLRRTIANFERLLCELNEHIKTLPDDKLDSPETKSLLKDINEALNATPKSGFIERLHNIIKRILKRDAFPNKDLRAQLADVAPDLVNAFVSPKTIQKEIRRLLSVLKCREVIRQLEATEIEALKKEESESNYDNLKEATKKALLDAEAAVQSAYVEKILSRVSSIKDSENIVARCKSSINDVLQTAPLPFMASVDDGSKYDAAVKEFQDYLKIFPAWAATMLSLKRASPCLPAVFSLAIIDEASQCEIPPMIPVLFRAQRIAIVGDSNQFPPVITLKEKRDLIFRRMYRLEGPEYRKFAYGENNAFSVLPQKETMLLDEHFRCVDGIAQYFNEEFYKDSLCLCCETGRNGESAINGLKPGMVWVDAAGGDEAEMDAALEYLRELKSKGFKGSVGVISPLRDLANRFKTYATNNKSAIPEQLDIESQINTANGFQGGECDVILFLLGLNGSRNHGSEWYITSEENKYIYNVSVSRAKYLFVAFGDKKRVLASGISYIKKLIPEERPKRKVSIGPGEERLRIALERAGIVTVPQYPIAGRYLDLAIPEKKIDIEVDGQAWHLDRNGCRKADDIHRDRLLEALGWKAVRFWHHDIVSDVSGCVKRVQALSQ